METIEKKMYSIRVVPETVLVPDPKNEGAKIVVPTYERTSKPDEKAKAANFLPEKFLHLELFEQSEEHFLGGDTKPYTEVLFANSNKILYDKLLSLVEDTAQYKVLNTKSMVILLTAKLPGLVVNRACNPYYATRMTKEGTRVILKSNKRNDAGNFELMPVVLEKLSFFLFDNQVNEIDLAIQFKTALNRINTWIKAASEQTVATAQKAAVAEDGGEAPE